MWNFICELKNNTSNLHQITTISDWENVVWSNRSRFKLQHSDWMFRIWEKQLEITDSMLCAVSWKWSWCDSVGNIFWQTLGLWASFKHQPSQIHSQLLMLTSSRLIWHDNEFFFPQWPLLSSNLSPEEQSWDVVEQETNIMDVQLTIMHKLCDAIKAKINQKMEKKNKFWGMFQTPNWIYVKN